MRVRLFDGDNNRKLWKHADLKTLSQRSRILLELRQSFLRYSAISSEVKKCLVTLHEAKDEEIVSGICRELITFLTNKRCFSVSLTLGGFILFLRIPKKVFNPSETSDL